MLEPTSNYCHPHRRPARALPPWTLSRPNARFAAVGAASMRWTLVEGPRRGTSEVQEQREGLSDLAEYYGADVSGAVLNARGRHRSHVLALRRGTLARRLPWSGSRTTRGGCQSSAMPSQMRTVVDEPEDIGIPGHGPGDDDRQRFRGGDAQGGTAAQVSSGCMVQGSIPCSVLLSECAPALGDPTVLPGSARVAPGSRALASVLPRPSSAGQEVEHPRRGAATPGTGQATARADQAVWARWPRLPGSAQHCRLGVGSLPTGPPPVSARPWSAAAPLDGVREVQPGLGARLQHLLGDSSAPDVEPS